MSAELDPAAQPAPPLRLLALALLSAGLLLFEIALTKIFSIVLWYHFGFLVISVALLGFAASGVWLSRREDLFEQGTRPLARLSGWAAIATAVAVFLVAHTQVDAFSILSDHNEGTLLLLMGALLVPFFLLGAAISASITLHRARPGGVYAANLIGSGLGCAAAIAVFDGLNASAPDAVLIAALGMAVAGVLFGIEASARAAAMPTIAAAALLLILTAWGGRADWLRLYAPKSKPLYHAEQWDRDNQPREVELADGTALPFIGYTMDPDSEEHVIVDTVDHGRVRMRVDEFALRDGKPAIGPSSLVRFTEWTSLSRVDAFLWPPGNPSYGLWGISPAFQGPYPRQVGITIDSWAMTNVMEWGGEGTPPPEVLEYLPAGLVHRIVDEPEILCIGSGGGMDLLTAKRFGSKRAVGVEINPGVVRAAREAFPELQGYLYEPSRTPNVEVHVAEGRHWLETDDHLYDVVQLSGVDTHSTTQAGAFSLSENFLYTAEAFDTYLEHVRDEGFVTLTRWVLPDSAGRPRNTLRLFVLAWEALERAGVEKPESHVYLVRSGLFSVIIFGKTAFTEEQIATLDAECARLSFDLLYHPRLYVPLHNFATGEEVPNTFEEFAEAEDQPDWLAAYPYDVASPTDDRPFFFETSRFRHLGSRDSFVNPLGGITAHGILAVLLVVLGFLAWAFVIAPLRRRAREEGGKSAGLPALLYFGALGLGFILVEVVLSQKFILYLGNPLYALSVVLFSVLIFSGLGSALSARVGDPRRALVVVVVLAFAYPPLADVVFDATLRLPTPGRIAIAVGLLAPLATAMGMPFPLGVQRISGRGPGLVAWAWGINGYTSVLGSCLTVILSISVGFTMVVWIGAAVYAVAWVAAPSLGNHQAASTSSATSR